MLNNQVVHIPSSEIKISFARSSGAGGQNVNKTSTKAVLHWSVGSSNILTSEEKKRVREKLANKINFFGDVVIISEEQRSQPQNRALAISRLEELVSKALYIPKKRRSTRPTKASRLRRMQSKKIRSAVKTGRHSIE